LTLGFAITLGQKAFRGMSIEIDIYRPLPKVTAQQAADYAEEYADLAWEMKSVVLNLR
jgi:hypothetical protein